MATFTLTTAAATERLADRFLLRRATVLADQFGRAMRAARHYEKASQDPGAATRQAFREVAG